MIKSNVSIPKESEEDYQSYDDLNKHYIQNSFTYKCNKIIKELSSHDEPYKYPEYLILKVCKLYHLNQFELVFFSQILTTQPCLELNSDMFYKGSKKIEVISNQSDRALFLYLMVVGYAVKSYLNDNATVYDTKSKEICSDFEGVFQYWAKKYAQQALKTNPKKLNSFYTQVIKSADNEDENFKNYNQIVDDLRRLAPQISESDSEDDLQKVQDGNKHEQK